MSGKLRILQVIGGSEFGGGVWIIRSYVRALQGRGHEVLVNSSVPAVAEEFMRIGCEVIPIWELRREINPRNDYRAMRRLTRLCRDRSIDVVHTHTSKGGFVGRAAARLAGVPFILHTAHGFAFHEASPRWALHLYSRLERLAGSWCDRIITVSEFHRQWALALRIATPEKIITVQNGISIDRLHPTKARDQARADLGLDVEDFVIGCIGRLARQKGLEVLFRAIARVRSEEPAARLILVGAGPLESSLRRLASALGLTGHVVFAGFRTDVGDVMNACDVVVSASFREGLSVSVMEAMAMSKAIVATDIGSNRELIEHRVSGILVPPADPDGLATAILSLARAPDEMARLSRAAKERFDAHFTEARMQERVLDVYDELLERRGLVGSGHMRS